MRINTNKWNKVRYTFYSPFYNLVGGYFSKSRESSIASLDFQKGDHVLIVGAGTGLDLEFLPNDCKIIVTDITPAMVEQSIKRNNTLGRKAQFFVMDGQNLDFADNTFDKIILHLILAVIPDPIDCISEVERVLKLGGQVAVFDKFVPKNSNVSLFRRFVNVFANLFFSDITRDFESILDASELTLVADREANFNGHFRLIKLIK